MKTHTQKYKNLKNGQTALIVVLFLTMFMLAVVFGFSSLALSQERVLRSAVFGKTSFFVAEGAHEDVLYKTIHHLDVSAIESLTINNHNATTTTSFQLEDRLIQTEASALKHTRNIESTLIAYDAHIPFAAHVDSNLTLPFGGAVNVEIHGDVYSNSPISETGGTIFGHAFSADSTGVFVGLHATGSVYSHKIQNSIIEGDAYYDDDTTSTGNTYLGGYFPGSPDQPTTTLPLTDAKINALELVAEAGGVITSPCPYVISDSTEFLGPIKINCDLTVEGNSTLNLTGPVWVAGNVLMNEIGGLSPVVKVSGTQFGKSVPVIADNPANKFSSSKISLSNDTSFEGNGFDGSYVFLISQNESEEKNPEFIAIEVADTVSGEFVVYANHGLVRLSNFASPSAVVGYRLEMYDDSKIFYEADLSSTVLSTSTKFYHFDWREVE